MASQTRNGNNAAMELIDHTTGLWRSWMIDAAVKLNLAEHLAKKPMTAEELAEETQTHAPSLFRLLRALASFGIFKIDNDQKWLMTPMAQLLEKRMKHFAPMLVSDIHLAWSSLVDSVKTGKPVFENVYGERLWDYLKSHPADFNNFKAGLHEFNDLFHSKIPDFYDFSQFKHIIDVGGNIGSFMVYVLNRVPNVTATVYDEAHVIEEAKAYVAASEVKDRISFISGNFLESVPAGGDCYIMKSALVDWNDDDAVKIISNIAKNMNERTRLLIIQSCIPEENKYHLGKHYDLLYLIVDGGKERTRKEFEAIVNKCGLRLNKVINTDLPLTDIMEIVA
ncbi:hypothetical protein B4U80_13281 [Leptotrombidium deliense]|uniref:Acetylserotonin O-methyltransferase n=1 Tax=Leptotrombidium deliense TaxID=299467 RepID=A0A443S8Z0_9ACAR|nr:hypothetical protein B4U80_13281 [Leptotrombidium deliense]